MHLERILIDMSGSDFELFHNWEPSLVLVTFFVFLGCLGNWGGGGLLARRGVLESSTLFFCGFVDLGSPLSNAIDILGRRCRVNLVFHHDWRRSVFLAQTMLKHPGFE